MKMFEHPFIILFTFSFVLFTSTAFADEEDPQTLKDDALKILKANTDKSATPEEYATAIFKLERAQALLESTGKADSDLGQDIATSLFWARRFSNVQVLSALDAMRGKQPAPPPAVKKPATTPKPAAPATPKVEGETPEMAKARAAEAAFAVAQAYAASHTNDDYAVAMAWFKMANEHPGSDQALRALDMAREAQIRFGGKKVTVEEVIPDTPEMALVKQGDDLVKAKKFEDSFKLFDQSLKMKETVIGHRHKAMAHYQRAQQIRDELKPRWQANREGYVKAYNASWVNTRSGKFYNPDAPPMLAWKKELAALQKESDVANKNFEEAEHEFAKLLKIAPDGKDFEAAGYMGLCMGVRPFFRMKGVTTLESFVKEYAPENDLQRSLYEFCKTEIERLKKGG